MSVSTTTVENNVPATITTDLRACTVEDFDGDQAQYDKLSQGKANSMYCVQDASQLPLLNLVYQSDKSKGVFIEITSCQSDKLAAGSSCITDLN